MVRSYLFPITCSGSLGEKAEVGLLIITSDPYEKIILFRPNCSFCHFLPSGQVEVKKERLPKIAYTSLAQEPKLAEAIGLLGLSSKPGKFGRLMSELSQLRTDSILKVLQGDSLNYTYTFSLPGDREGSFKNLVLSKINGGYLGFVLEFQAENTFLDMQSYEGKVVKYDLEGNEIFQASVKSSKGISGGRTNETCLASVSSVCLEYFQPNHLYRQECMEWETTITITCFGNANGGGGGTELPGTYIPVSDSGSGETWGGGSGTGGSGSGTSTGGSDGGRYGYDDSDPIGVREPATWPGAEEGFPYRWWLDDEWLDDNFVLGLDQNRYPSLTEAEKQLVRKYPGQAAMIYRNREKAFSETDRLFPGEPALNDKADAFRHAFFNAINERDCGKDPVSRESIAKLFFAHESEVPVELQLEKEMDLWNNTVGQSIGDVFFPIIASDQAMVSEVLSKLVSGALRYLTPLDFVSSPRWPSGLNGITFDTRLTPTDR
jgi:hypothetical protein